MHEDAEYQTRGECSCSLQAHAELGAFCLPLSTATVFHATAPSGKITEFLFTFLKKAAALTSFNPSVPGLLDGARGNYRGRINGFR